MAAIEGLYMLGEVEKVATLYPRARQLIDTGTICILIMSRFPQTIAGIAATAARNWTRPKNTFRSQCSKPCRFLTSSNKRTYGVFHAMMLIDRAAQGDRERARALLNDALQSYQRIPECPAMWG
jgi:hypothetical protein